MKTGIARWEQVLFEKWYEGLIGSILVSFKEGV